jgi:hypothetical protein
MDAMNKEKIERTREYVLESTLPEETKDGLGALLDSSEISSNGAPDKIGALSDTLHQFVLQWVRHCVRNPEMIDAAVQRHATSCPMAASSGRIGILLRCIQSWPLAFFASVCVLSPNFPAIVDAVKGLIK